MVSLRLMKLCFFLIRLPLLLFGPVVNVFGTQHGHNRQNLIRTPQINTQNQNLGQLRFKREFGHLSPQPRQETFRIQRSQLKQQFHRCNHSIHRGRVHERKIKQIIDPHGFQHKHRIRQISPLNLGYSVGQHFISIRTLRVQSITFSRSSSSSPSSTLTRLRLTDGNHNQVVHGEFRIVRVLLHKTRINDVIDSINRDTCFGNVGRKDYFSASWWCRFKDFRLLFGGQCRIDG
ncbi:hypothetical protein BJ741DRAFT_324813 [Chytriomyces cf. hyalinus JEL632]|nr:hypothetical protein BJ741DRAFT_324813 [Chytriomyces cf. hyalinus JEL632]